MIKDIWYKLSRFSISRYMIYIRNVTALCDFWPPNVNEGSQNCGPEDAATTCGDCWGARGVQEAAISRRTRKQGWPQVAEVPMKGNEFSEPRGLHVPIHRMLNSLTWYLVFDVHTACSLCCKLVYSPTLPLPPWSSILRATEMLSPYKNNNILLLK